MAEGTLTETIRKIVAKAEPYIPQVPKPKKKLSLQTKLTWTTGALVIYLVMGQTPLFGATAPEFDFLAFARVIFASQQGSLVELGIGPIVTGGLLMQLLRGSDILKFDFKNPAERGVFQTATKLVTYIVIVAESIVYGVAVYGPNISEPTVMYILIGQLMGASIIVMFLDELIQKGWGLGSGISIFICAGVAQQILWSVFSPLPAGDGGAIGIFHISSSGNSRHGDNWNSSDDDAALAMSHLSRRSLTFFLYAASESASVHPSKKSPPVLWTPPRVFPFLGFLLKSFFSECLLNAFGRPSSPLSWPERE